MGFLFTVLLAVEESEESSGGIFGFIWMAGTCWGIWHLNKKRKRQGFTDWLGACIVALMGWWLFMLQILTRNWWSRRQNRQRSVSQFPSKNVFKSQVKNVNQTVRIPKDAYDFEEVCAEWMREAGYSDARKTQNSSDGGVDVISSTAVAQSKFTPGNKVGAPAVRNLVGARVQNNKSIALFFHYGLGYTEEALQTAKETGVELFRFDADSQRFFKIV